jgi:hypothetical protein
MKQHCASYGSEGFWFNSKWVRQSCAPKFSVSATHPDLSMMRRVLLPPPGKRGVKLPLQHHALLDCGAPADVKRIGNRDGPCT